VSADIQFRQAEAIFCDALEIPAAKRPDFLRERTMGDTVLLADVSSLLEAYEQQEQLNRQADWEPVVTAAPRRVGVYELDRLIGKGGMGAVYLAHRGDGQFEQQAAVKLLALPLEIDAFRRRFQQERQILATLDHPNITRLIDGGLTPQGDPYLVMEYVAGQPLDRYCDQRRLPVSERLALFRQVLSAVDYAHRHLIVHGDLKPSNILVTEEGAVKLLDFGTSRFLDEETKTVTAAALTPKYASPEQLRGEPLTMASDVFSLGMILYELLTGGSAFRASGSFLSVFKRALQEMNPTEPAAAVTDDAAAQRRASLSELQQFVRGDLSSILLKALSYDPSRRYQLIAEFEADLEYHRLGRPVLARRQTSLYRTGKFVRRHRAALGTVAAVVVSLGAAVSYAYREQRSALEEGRRAKVMNTFLMRLFQSINPAYGGRWNMTPVELVDRAATQADKMLANEPSSRAQFLLGVGGDMIFTRGVSEALTVFKKGLEAARQGGDAGLEGESLAFIGYLQAAANDCPAALKSMHEAEAIRLRYQGKVAPEWRFSNLLNEADTALLCGGDLRAAREKSAEAVAFARRIPDDSLEEGTPPRIMKAVALVQAAQLQGCDRAQPLLDEVLAMTHNDSDMAGQEANALFSEGTCLVARGQWADALPPLERAVDVALRLWGETNDITREFHAFHAYALAEAGQSDRAIHEALASVVNLECHIPYSCDAALAFAMEALMTAGDQGHALPLARQIADANMGVSVIGKTGLFVAYTESNQSVAARPYRSAAERFATRIARGKWRSRIERALRND